MSDSARTRLNWSPILEWVQRFGAILTVAAIAIFGFWGGHFLLPGQEHAEEESQSTEPVTSAEVNSVELTDEKLAAAHLKTMVVSQVEFQAHKSVPGVIVFDSTKKVELRATVDCVVKQTLVQLAQQVERGQPILVLTGPAVGAARNEVSQCESNLDLLKREYEWTLDTHTNIKALLDFLKQSPTSAQLKERFDDLNLGEHRSEILSSYSELSLARKSNERIEGLQSQGAISDRVANERKSSLDVAEAKFNSVREVMNFQATQQLARAESELEAERNRLEVCRSKLNTLLGEQPQKPDHLQLDGTADAPSDTTEFVINAPRAGQVVALPAVSSSRFEPGEVMAEIADVTDVWIEAQVSQRDWHSLQLEPMQTLAVRAPAAPHVAMTAVVKHVGTSVSKSTLTIPLIAEMRNDDGKFRPGMSVWVDIPMSEKRSAIVVAEGAVQRNESATFVFVQTSEHAFERRDVVVGEESENQVEITSGLSEGEKVVVEGAFFLKSELLLSEEE